MNVFLIAEAGACHDGSQLKALQLVRHAARAGASAIKFQYWSSVARMVARRNALDYAPIYERYRLPLDWLPGLQNEANDRGVELMCTTYLPEDVDVIAPYVSRLKISSFEANDLVHLAAHVPHLRAGKEVIVSMGMDASPTIVREWLDRGRDDQSGRITTLYCVSAYPAPLHLLNLWRLRQRIDYDTNRYFDGFSDHSCPTETLTGALAVSAGARVIERHLRLPDTFDENPDNATAMLPSDFGHYAANVMAAALAVGDFATMIEPNPAEDAMRVYRVSP